MSSTTSTHDELCLQTILSKRNQRNLDGSKKKRKPDSNADLPLMSEKEAAALLRYLPLSLVGGEISEERPLICQSKLGGAMRLEVPPGHGPLVLSPSSQIVIGLWRDHPTLFQRFLKRAMGLSHFAGKPTEDIHRWLLKHMDGDPLHQPVGWSLQKSLVVRHIAFNKDLTEPNPKRPDIDDTLLPQLCHETLLTQPTTIAKTVQCIRNDSSAEHKEQQQPSSSRLPYLGFRRTIWSHADYHIATEHRGWIFDVTLGKVVSSPSLPSSPSNAAIPCPEGFVFIVLPKCLPRTVEKASSGTKPFTGSEYTTVAFMVPHEPACLDEGEFHIENEELRDWVRNKLSTNDLKSILQKTVRVQAPSVALPSGARVAGVDLADACMKQLMHPKQLGQFIPDVQAFVSALVSALKRLAVIIWEDSDAKATEVASLMMGAMIASRAVDWRPGQFLVRKWIALARSAYESPYRSAWKRQEVPEDAPWMSLSAVQEVIGKLGKHEQDQEVQEEGKEGKEGKEDKEGSPDEIAGSIIASLCLDEVKSMAGDYIMFRWFARAPVSKLRSLGNDTMAEQRRSVSLEYGLDHHVEPRVVLLLPFKWLREVYPPTSPATPYGVLMKNLFKWVTGRNPRVGPMSHWDNEFTRDVLAAQLKMRQMFERTLETASDADVDTEDAECQLFSMQYDIPAGYLAGSILPYQGVVERQPVLVTVDPSNLSRFVVIPKPTRSVKSIDLSDSVSEEAQRLAKAHYAKGNIPMDRVTPLHSSMRSAKARFDCDSEAWFVKLDAHAQEQPWEVCRRLHIPNLRSEMPALEAVSTLIQESGVSSSAVQRAITLLSHYKSAFAMPRISRMGGSIQESVTVHDIEAFQLLCKLAQSYPDALKQSDTTMFGFDIPCIPVMRRLRAVLSEYCREGSGGGSGGGTGGTGPLKRRLDDQKKRAMRKAQVDALEEMSSTLEEGSINSFFLCMTVGMGKTLIVANLIDRWRNSNTNAVIWTVPSSALLSVANELDTVFEGLVDVLVPTKTPLADAEHFPKGVRIRNKFLTQTEADTRTNATLKKTTLQRIKTLQAATQNEEWPTVLDIMKQLRTMPVPIKILQDTGVGRLYKQTLGKSTDMAIATLANDTVQCWRKGLGGNSPPKSSSTKSSSTKSSSTKQKTIERQLFPRHGRISLVTHDHLRMMPELVEVASRTMIVVDEVHKCMSVGTQRTGVSLHLARLSPAMVCLTGTPICKPDQISVIGWLEQCVPFEVNERNFWTACNGMVAKRVNTGVHMHKADTLVEMTAEEHETYRHFVPRGMDGTSVAPNFVEAFRFVYSLMVRHLASRAAELVQSSRALLSNLLELQQSEARAIEAERALLDDSAADDSAADNPQAAAASSLLQTTPQRVLVVAESKAHGIKIADELLKTHGIGAQEMLMVGYSECTTESGTTLPCQKSIFMTEASVKDGTDSPVSIMIVPQRYAEGWTGTWCTVLLTSVYPSNQATREQMEGRINRLSCERKVRWMERLHMGILTYVLKKHDKAQSLSDVIKQMTDEYCE